MFWYILLTVFFINIIFIRSYSTFARIHYIKKFKNSKIINTLESKNIKKKKRNKHSSIIQRIIRYMNGFIQYELYLVGCIPSQRLRQLIWKKCFLMKIGKNVTIYGGADIRHPWNIRIGNNCAIGNNVILDGRNHIVLKNNVNLSQGVWIWTAQHDVNSIDFDCKPDIYHSKVIIGERAWLGPRTIILPGRRIAEGSVLAAGGVLTKNTEPFGIYGGIPAQKIGNRNRNINYDIDKNYLPFF